MLGMVGAMEELGLTLLQQAAEVRVDIPGMEETEAITEMEAMVLEEGVVEGMELLILVVVAVG